VVRRAIAAGRIVELAGPVSHHPDQLPDAADRQVLAHQQHQRGVGHQHDRREVLDRVVSEIALERRHRGVGAGGGHDEGVAVGRSLLCGHDADQAGRAGAIIDDDRPALPRADPLGDEPRYAVKRPAGRIRHDQADRLCRIGLGAGARRQRPQACEQRRRREKPGCMTAAQMHGVPLTGFSI
jgi:hypothetical protein